ncbi:MAG: hypothetical protein KUG69_14725 [Marinosulfonomonas sp.]|nr:hypothetical protein [Marinosulfonomonas sp.]
MKKLNRHADLSYKMAETVGVDLTEVGQRGYFPPETVRSSIFSCMGCDDTSACEHWLEDHSKGAGETPGYCRNSDLFAKLKRG